MITQSVRVENRKIVICSEEKEIHGATIKQLAKLLEPLGYIQIDQSQLVNMHYVESVRGNEIRFTNSNQVCYVSRRNLKIVKDKLRHYTT